MRNRLLAIRSQVLALIVLLSLASPAATLAAGSSNPYDKFRNHTYSNKGLMSEQEELQLGAQVHQQVLQQYRLVRDPEINDYVQRLGERLARVSQRPNIPYHFYVIDDPSVNAFAIPGGYVYVHTGLLRIAQGEDELAAAMAHEIGHVAARHGLKNIKKAQRTALIFGILGIGAEVATGGSGAGQMARAASELLAAGIITKNSRDYEREADYLGLYGMQAAGYDPEGMVRIFQRLGSSSSAKESATGGIFASHPNSGERVRNTELEIRDHLAGVVAQRSYATNGTSRPRRAAQRRNASYAPSNDEFYAMKQALSNYENGNRGYRQGRSNYPANYPNDQPARNDRPVLKRRP